MAVILTVVAMMSALPTTAIMPVRMRDVAVALAALAAAESERPAAAALRPLMHRELGNGTRRRRLAFDARKGRANQTSMSRPEILVARIGRLRLVGLGRGLRLRHGGG